MTIVFFIPLAIIALWESVVEHGSLKKRYMQSWLAPLSDTEEDSEDVRNPKVYPEDDEELDNGNGHEGLQITRVRFEELTSVFPNAALVGDHNSPLSSIFRFWSLRFVIVTRGGYSQRD